MDLVMYTTHCPQCNVLSKKLKQKNLSFVEVEDVTVMRELQISAVPALQVNGAILNFKEAVSWINSLEE